MGSGPGKADRHGLSWVHVMRLFPDDKAAERWFESVRWPHGIHCPYCDSEEIQEKTTHPTMPHRCRGCRKFFSVRVGTCMHRSKLGYQVWALAIYVLTTGIKGTSSMKIHRDLNITQKSAWHLAHRIREAWVENEDVWSPFDGPVEADETFVGGKRKNMPKWKREKLTGRGAVGKTAVAGIKDRETKQVRTKVVRNTDAETLQGFVRESVVPGATVYTDDATAYQSLNRKGFHHDSVKHSVGEYVKDVDVHTNGIESLWSMFKRGFVGTYHRMSPKHLHRYIREFEGRQNFRELDTIDQMTLVVIGMIGRRLTYKSLVGKAA